MNKNLHRFGLVPSLNGRNISLCACQIQCHGLEPAFGTSYHQWRLYTVQSTD
uniref:Uncharacterized protein n=1 Tax=Physcomitrium patens TaxID=3218 RepID=A0A2K1IZ13_PHYPA|nr:hypothetical protein PHYPA_024339 [Physcomitrium patens]